MFSPFEILMDCLLLIVSEVRSSPRFIIYCFRFIVFCVGFLIAASIANM